MSNQSPEAAEAVCRRAEELANERELTSEEKERNALDLLLVSCEWLKTFPEVSRAIQAAYFGSPIDKEDLAKGKITFRRGGHVWELIIRKAFNVEELSLTKLPPIEIKEPTDLHEEARVIVLRQGEAVISATIHYSHIFVDGKNPIIHTDTDLAVAYALMLMNDFRDCDRRHF